MSTGKFKGSVGQLMANYGFAMGGNGLSMAGAGTAASGSERDLSQTVFSPGQGNTVAEFLQALPKVKGRPLIASDDGTNPTLEVEVQQADAPFSGPTLPIYTEGGTVADGVTDLGDAETFTLARIGLKIAALKIDAASAPRNASRNPVEPRIRMATADLLRTLNTLIAIGDTNAPNFKSLAQFPTDHTGRVDSTAFLTPASSFQAAALALSKVCPTGSGAGEGPHCLVGNDGMLKTLMGASIGVDDCGWRRDPRTGLFVYHFMGVPFYRAPLVTTPATSISSLYAINLGSTGMALVHGYGTAESLGLQVDEEPTQTGTATRGLLVHGAYSLVAWEPEAFFVCDNVTVQ